jgi:hypothetical protein
MSQRSASILRQAQDEVMALAQRFGHVVMRSVLVSREVQLVDALA